MVAEIQYISPPHSPHHRCCTQMLLASPSFCHVGYKHFWVSLTHTWSWNLRVCATVRLWCKRSFRVLLRWGESSMHALKYCSSSQNGEDTIGCKGFGVRLSYFIQLTGKGRKISGFTGEKCVSVRTAMTKDFAPWNASWRTQHDVFLYSLYNMY